MPSIDVAMRSSVSRGALDFLAAAVRPVVQRDIISDTKGKVSDVQTAFSSWDNCMQATFCKWPVIAIIVIGALFIFSIVWCFARCLCCGMSCCCECFYCLKCCGNCCGCCDTPHKKHKYLDEPYIPPNQGYRSEAPMHAPMHTPVYAAPMAASTKPEAPQYAEFDMSKKGAGGEDSLPAMPSWEGSGSRKIEVDHDAVELEQMKKPEANGQPQGPTLPLMTGTAGTPGPVSPLTPSPQDPYGPPPISRQGSNAYLTGAAAIAAADPYARQGNGYHGNDPYGHSASDLGRDQGSPGMNAGYGMAGAGPMGSGRPSPRPREYGGNGGYGAPPPMNQGYGGPRSPQGGPGSYDNYRRNGNGTPGAMPGFGSDTINREPSIPDVMGGAYADQAPRRSPAPMSTQREPRIPDVMGGGAYANQSPRRSPAPPSDQREPRIPDVMGGAYDQPPRRSPAPQDQGMRGGYTRSPAPYGAPPPQRQFSSDSQRPLAGRPPPRQFSPAPVSPTNLQNNAGFDFNSGFSRPSTGDNAAYEHRQQQAGSPPPQQQQHTGGGGYPGFKPYQPPSAGGDHGRAQQNWSGL